jgi:uncharacterized membrane protein
VYRFWRDVENLPRFMSHLEWVENRGAGRSRWRAKGPTGAVVEWDAEIAEDLPYERISWRSVEGAEVPMRGTVHFRPAPGGRGSEIHVQMHHRFAGGRLGAAVAKLVGREQIAADLRRLKQVLETGEVVHSDASIHRGMHPARPESRFAEQRKVLQ